MLFALLCLGGAAALQGLGSPSEKVFKPDRRPQKRFEPEEKPRFKPGGPSGKPPPKKRAPTQQKIEWLEDEDADRSMLHILLLKQTFEQPRMSVPYAAGALTMVLGMDEEEANEHAAFANKHGFATLGLWPAEESLEYADALQGRDLIIRCVPMAQGKSEWQNPQPTRANAPFESLPGVPAE
ncbi:hypothetical protein M885DRAFT_506615 [Pelagophyceae sp. CCMP2097]|nr:hypothetical protein M885DRAFT_506615 [Pelagophyceae sp. CCMP2097]|mmetsp:Transcript_8854/g.29236  ORF Transcript_8854/g.29236 Transcript_8854/m.29236 type:complete len:182 (-) Transcript_8854:21-566(-)